jgi:dTDP-4-dehydrorhamnose 3,5-epimerase
MEFIPTAIPEVLIIEPDVHRDARGFFLETYQEEKYRAGGVLPAFVQDNHSKSVKNTLRGLHAQLKHPQGKLVRVVEGEVFDVAVDIRLDSPSFGCWTGVHLTAENFRQFYIPEGFAHGFCVLSEVAQFQYKCTDFYYPSDEITVLWSDPEIGIEWPVANPLLSEKDQTAPPLSEVREQLI